MINPTPSMEKRRTTYLLAWLAYIVFTRCAFPVFSITVMQLSIVLSMIGAWLYYYPGGLFTTTLTIPYHYLMLRYFSDDPTIWNEAFNPFGISTQLLISGLTALIQSKKRKLSHRKEQLEKRIELRTQELNRLNNYLIEKQEKQHVLLCHTLLQSISDSLHTMARETSTLGSCLLAENNPKAFQAVRLNQLINQTAAYVENYNFIDYSLNDNQAEFSQLVKNIITTFEETAETHFDLKINDSLKRLPEATQYDLYRITHEAVTNAVRHGRAKQVEIALETTPVSWMLTVMNDGNPLPETIKEGSGSSMIRQRANKINATVTLKKTLDGRTRFECVSNQNTTTE